jgi:hypothetical protein
MGIERDFFTESPSIPENDYSEQEGNGNIFWREEA